MKGNIVYLDQVSVLSQVWYKERLNKYADVAITKLDAANGIFLLQLTDTQTATFPNLLNYEILFIKGDGDRRYYFEVKFLQMKDIHLDRLFIFNDLLVRGCRTDIK